VTESARLFEFVIPMVPPNWNNPGTVSEYEQRLGPVAKLACLAVSILDICQPAIAAPAALGPGLTHWCLAHFLLDGHHKMQAAARANMPVRLLTLLSIDYSLARRDDIIALPAILERA
jgi:hypothetical protein